MPALQETTSALPSDAILKLAELERVLRDMGHVLVTFSGGVDSALVLKVAVQVLGERAIALTAASATFPPEELRAAVEFAASIGAQHRVIESAELESEGYAANAGNRCYFCKSELFDLSRREAELLGVDWIVDGTILDDLGEHRPGLQAAGEHQVRHPLVEAGFTKPMVRQIARALGLPLWDKPAFACLGSRFPVGTRVTVERIRQVQRVESRLRTLGFKQFRARWHELEGQPMVRLEMDPDSLAALVAPGIREAVIEVCQAEGFRWVTLDLQGYKRGNLSTAFSA